MINDKSIIIIIITWKIFTPGLADGFSKET